MSSTQVDVSTVALAYVCADQFVPHGNMLQGPPIPCTDVRVKYNALGGTLLGVCVAQMVRDGLVRFSAGTFKKMFVMTAKHAVLERVPGCAPPSGQGLDAWLYAAIPANESARAYDVVRWAYGEDVMNPLTTIVDMVSAELAEKDYFRLTLSEGGAGSKLLKAFDLKSKWAADCEKVQQLRADAIVARELIDSTRAQDPEAWDLLVKELGDGMRSRQEQQSSGGSFND